MDNMFAQQLQNAGQRQKDINGKTYAITLLPASQGLAVGNRLIKSLGPAIGVLLDSSQIEEVLFPEDQSMFTDISIALVRQLDELDVESTIKLLLNGATCNSQPINFDQHFAGNYGEMVAVTEFALKENFGDFFITYLGSKGLGIHTLKQALQPRVKDTTPEESED